MIIKHFIPKQRGVQVAGVQMTLNASLTAVIQLSGLLTFHRRCVLLHTLTAPFCKS